MSHAREVEEILVATNAILKNDHFVYVSGDHGSGWISKDHLFPHTEKVEKLCNWLAELVADLGAEWICGPATGGLIVAQWTGRKLGIPAYFAEHGQAQPGQLRGDFTLTRGYDQAVSGRPGLVVDDIVNTGHSSRQTVDAIRAVGGTVLASACLVTRGNAGAADIGVEDFRFLLQYDIPSWPGAACPLCQHQMPVNTRYAHGADFLKEADQT